MEILGYIGFAALLLLAVTWTIGVRVRLGAGIGVILGALFFVVAAIVLGVSGANKLHSLWIVPTGFLLSIFIGSLGVYAPAPFQVFRYVAGAFANMVRAGIPAERIKAAQDAADMKAVIDWSKTETEK